MGLSTHSYSQVVGHSQLFSGGRNGSQYFNSVERYDPSVNQWTAVVSMTTKRGFVGVGVLDGSLYAVGGSVTCTFLSTNLSKCQGVQDIRFYRLHRFYKVLQILIFTDLKHQIFRFFNKKNLHGNKTCETFIFLK